MIPDYLAINFTYGDVVLVLVDELVDVLVEVVLVDVLVEVDVLVLVDVVLVLVDVLVLVEVDVLVDVEVVVVEVFSLMLPSAQMSNVPPLETCHTVIFQIFRSKTIGEALLVLAALTNSGALLCT